jgi:hypothetical protein
VFGRDRPVTGRYAFSERKPPGKLSWTAEARIPVGFRAGSK